MSDPTIRIQRTLKAPPKKVFELWTEPEFVRQWFGGLDTEVRGILMDLRPGGRYSLKVETEAGASTISGEFLEVDPPKRLVYTWRVEGPQGDMPSTTVEVTFEDKGGSTELSLSHGPFLQPESKAFHNDGWRACFAALDELIADL